MIFFLLRPAERVVVVPDELDAVSLASEPELVKNTFDIGTGAIADQLLGQLDAGLVDLGAKRW